MGGVCMGQCVRVYVCVNVHSGKCVCVCLVCSVRVFCKRACVRMYMRVCLYECVYLHMCVRVHVCMSMRVCL